MKVDCESGRTARVEIEFAPWFRSKAQSRMFRLLRRRQRTPLHTRPASTTRQDSYIRSYIAALRNRYPLADPASLIASFLLLHELTAIVPLFLGFVGLRSIGAGEKLVQLAIPESGNDRESTWAAAKLEKWVKEGTEQGERIGRRYGVLGYTKESREDRELRKATNLDSTLEAVELHPNTLAIGGDVANLVAAYVLVKVSLSHRTFEKVGTHLSLHQAMLPLRLLVSARLAPRLANSMVGRFQGLRRIGAKWIRKKESPI